VRRYAAWLLANHWHAFRSSWAPNLLFTRQQRTVHRVLLRAVLAG
jgi:hypothetical protein